MTRVIKRREKMARRSRINTDVKPVRKIDIVNASKDELIEYLCQTINYEVEKGDDADCDLIRECSDWLDELTSAVISFTPEELKAKLDAIKSSNSTCVSCPTSTTHTSYITKRKVWARVTILVASLVLLSFLSISVMAKYAGYDSTWDFVYITIEKWCGLNLGEEYNADGITVIKNTGATTYKNMDEFLSNESICIIYPHTMPDDIKITGVHFVERTDNKYMLYFTFSHGTNTFNVANYYSSDSESLSSYESITINSFTYYTKRINDDLYYAVLQYNGFEYIIQSSNYDDLITIINNMKG